MSSRRINKRGPERPTAGDIAEVASGRGSSADKAEVAGFGAHSHTALGAKARAAIKKVGYHPRSTATHKHGTARHRLGRKGGVRKH